MRAVIQRVNEAKVSIDNQIKGEIDKGLLILLGVAPDDDAADLNYLIKKITQLRIFSDEEGKMNLSCEAVKGSYLVVSQFTLFANTQKGNRPSYLKSAPPELAEKMYASFIHQLSLVTSSKIATGEFGADMKVSFTNDGPVTIIIDSKQKDL